MPLGSVWARNAALNACYGSGHAAGWPDTVRLRLLTGDPREGGVELPPDGGYASVLVDNIDAVFPPAAGGEIEAEIPLPTATGAWADVGRWWALEHPATGALLDVGRCRPAADATDAGVVVVVTALIRYDEQSD